MVPRVGAKFAIFCRNPLFQAKRDHEPTSDGQPASAAWGRLVRKALQRT